MGAHINGEGRFQSDKYPSCPAGKVPLSTKDKTAQDLLHVYAQRRRAVDAEFSADLETALRTDGFEPAEGGYVVVKQSDLDWLLGTVLNGVDIIRSEGLDDDEECDEIAERVFEMAAEYGIDVGDESEEETGS